MENQAAIVSELISNYGNNVLADIPFPKAWCKDISSVKAIYLGCDPSNKKNIRFEFVFALENNKPLFNNFIKTNEANLREVDLNWENVYVQNLCQNYFKEETSKNIKLWKKIAKEYWIDNLRKELSIFDLKIPVLLSSYSLYEVLLKKGVEKIKPIEFYCCREKIPVKPELNLLNRPLIPFFRNRQKRDYHLSNPDWINYKLLIKEILFRN